MTIKHVACATVLLILATVSSYAQTSGTPADSVAAAPLTAPPADSAAVAPVTSPPPAQQVHSSQPSFRDRLYFGGSVVFSLGGDVSTIGVYPMVGYKIRPKWSLGLEVGYEHVSFDDFDQSADNYGGSVFTRYRLTPSVYAHAEYQMINYEVFTSLTSSERDWVPFLLLGGGLSRQMSPRTAVYAEVLFDVLRDNNSPYEDWEPFISVGVGVGF